MRLAAGLRPDPLGEVERSPRPLAAIGGGVLLIRGREGREGKREGRRKGGEEREKGGGKGLPPLHLTSGYWPVDAAKLHSRSVNFHADPTTLAMCWVQRISIPEPNFVKV